ncbi:MAG: FMN-binding protein [Planctomycetota bacterium]
MHYIWNDIRPEPKRWREGIRLLDHAFKVNEQNPGAQRPVAWELGSLYGIEEDWIRAAYYWRIGKGENTPQFILACLKLGNDTKPIQQLNLLGSDQTRFGSIIRLWGEAEKLSTALQMADEGAEKGLRDMTCLAAGSACRYAGEFPLAAFYFNRAATTWKGTQDATQNRKWARDGKEAMEAISWIDLSSLKDGTYEGEGQGYNDKLTVMLTVENEMIASVEVTKHNEKQPLNTLTIIPKAIVRQQGIQRVDTMTGATFTAEGIVHAAAKALAKAGTPLPDQVPYTEPQEEE